MGSGGLSEVGAREEGRTAMDEPQSMGRRNLHVGGKMTPTKWRKNPNRLWPIGEKEERRQSLSL